MIPSEKINDICKECGFEFDEPVIEKLGTYLNLLVKWNKAMNLVGPETPEKILSSLLVDSFHLAGFIKSLPLPPQPECWDLGAGAGLPGIALRMLWQEGAYTLVDSRGKRVLFLRNVLAACPLPGVFTFEGRAEVFMPKRPPADLVVSRAFMPWEKVLELVKSYTKPGGICLFLTLEPMPDAIPSGWEPLALEEYSVQAGSRFFWAIVRKLD